MQAIKLYNVLSFDPQEHCTQIIVIKRTLFY